MEIIVATAGSWASATRRHSKARRNASTSCARNSATGRGSRLATTNWEKCRCSAGKAECGWQAGIAPRRQLGLKPFWKFAIGRYLLIGVSSPLIALPANQPDTLPEEWPEWQQLREAHLAEIRAAFDDLQSGAARVAVLPRPDGVAVSGRVKNQCAAGCPKWNKRFSDICTRASSCGKAGCCREFQPSGFWAGTSAVSPRRCMKPIIGGHSACGSAPHCPALNC